MGKALEQSVQVSPLYVFNQRIATLLVNLLIDNLAAQLLITDMHAAFVILWDQRRCVLDRRNVKRKCARLDSAPSIQDIAMILCVASHSRVAALSRR